MLEKRAGAGECRLKPRHNVRKHAEARPGPARDSVMQHGEFGFLNFGLVLLGAAVLSVPIARRLGLSAIVAYLMAGIIIGPYGLAAFGTPESIIPVSELGIVMLLFLIGLELELGAS
jgi:predicted Kef-type K+ transport protein